MFIRFDRATNVTDGRTDRWTDTARRYRPRLCIASRGKNCNNNNNNNNKHDNVYGAVIMAEPLREFTRFI